jgi:sugar lactone lactonase YvrE
MNRQFLFLTSIALVLGVVGQTRADFMLTATGQADGFGLSTFATGFPVVQGIGPIGVAFPTTGGVLVSDYAGDVWLLPKDTDGQNVSSIPVAQAYGFGNATSLAQIRGNVYMTQGIALSVVQLNPTGTFDQLIASIPAFVSNNLNGMTADPLNGHLFFSQSTTGGQPNRIYDVDPVGKTFTVFSESTTYTNQLIFNPSGTTIYAGSAYPGPVYNAVTGFDATTGATVFGPVSFPGISNGVALGSGSLAGDLFVNTQYGDLIELNLSTQSQTVIASGGTGGFTLHADPNDGSLLVVQDGSLYRLTPPPDGGFYSPTPVPEPTSFTLLGIGIIVIGGYTCRWRAPAAA